ncbi:MAG TPA: DnaB-like helicase C-terminal domain-containing protein [Candidatus Deferrimicrobium sp.]|nr:DnaB-like helicase C-terminal domain-containing protein [Candidatus Deferrimicrobium sp.]
MTTDRTEFRLVAGALATPQHLEKLQKLGMSSSLFEDGDLKAVFDAFQWYCSNHNGEGGKIDLPLFTAYLTEERHVTPAIATLVDKLTDAGGEDMATLVEMLDRLKTRAARRKLRTISDSINGFTDDEKQGRRVEDFAAEISEQLRQVARLSSQSKQEPIRDELLRYIEEVRTRETGRPSILGMSIAPYDNLNTAISGLRPGFYYAVGGAPRRGKTNLMLRLATLVARNEKVPVLYYSFEQTKHVLLTRVLSQESLINPLILQRGDIRNKADLVTRFNKGIKETSAYMDNFYLFEGDRQDTLEHIRSVAYGIMDSHHTDHCAIFIDFLQKVPTVNPYASLQKQVDEVSGLIAQLSTELQSPIVAVSSFDKDGCRLDSEMSKERPTMFNCTGGGDIEYDADVALIIVKDYHDTAQLEEKIANAVREGGVSPHHIPHFDILNLFIDKNRDAPEGGNIIVQFLFLIEDNQMVELGYKDVEERYSYAKAGKIFEWLLERGYLEAVGPGEH